MDSPEKPFACAEPDCGMRFTNEDHLNVHSKKHDLELQLGSGLKSAIFPADQTPTPTRFIRNCEEVGLFQDLQNVNPFDEGFKEAMEKGRMLVSADGINTGPTIDDALHTPHIFPSPSDVSDAKDTIKIITDPTTVTHFESTVQTKLTNEITVQENVTTIQSNIEMRKSGYSTVIASNDPNLIKLVVKNSENDALLTDTTKLPIFSQKSIEEALDSLKSEAMNKERNDSLIKTLKKDMKNTLKNIDHQNIEFSKKGKKRRAEVATENDKYEVMLKLPNGELVHMQSLAEKEKQLSDPKQKLKDAIENKLKNEIEEKIKLDIENRINSQIQSGNFILKVKDPDTINSSITKNALVNIAPKPSSNLVPVIVTAPNLLLPMHNLCIPQVNISNSILTGPKIKPARIRSTKTIDRVTHHKINCPILKIVGGVCNCSDTSKLDCKEHDPHKVNKVAEKNLHFDSLQSKDKRTTVSDITGSTQGVGNTKMILMEPKINLELEKKSSHAFSQRHGNQAAVKRYREKQKSLFQRTLKINELVQNENQSLHAELAALKNIITDHCHSCPIADVLRRKLRETQMLPENK